MEWRQNESGWRPFFSETHRGRREPPSVIHAIQVQWRGQVVGQYDVSPTVVVAVVVVYFWFDTFGLTMMDCGVAASERSRGGRRHDRRLGGWAGAKLGVVSCFRVIVVACRPCVAPPHCLFPLYSRQWKEAMPGVRFARKWRRPHVVPYCFLLRVDGWRRIWGGRGAVLYATYVSGDATYGPQSFDRPMTVALAIGQCQTPVSTCRDRSARRTLV